MILSTQTDVLAKTFGDEEAVRILAKNGFDAIDYSMFGMEKPEHFLNSPEAVKHIEAVRDAAKAAGVYFNQAHAPFPSYRDGNGEYNAFIPGALKRAIEYAGILGAKIIIIHPISVPGDAEAQRKLNLELYEGLIPTLRENGLKAALENMFGWNSAGGHATPGACATPEQFCEYLDMLPSDCFTACLDIGHSGLIGIPAADMIRGLGHDRLGALHVHDNNEITDMHTLPFTEKLNWRAITAALREISYKGEFTFEADNFLKKFPDELRPAASKLMQDVGRRLIAMIEE